MKKILYFVGFISFSGAMYLYLKRQLELALQYEYDVKKWKILKMDKEEAQVEIVVSLTNKSSFEIEILGYDLAFYYQDINVGRVFSTEKTGIKAEASIDIKTNTIVNFNTLKAAILPFVTAVLQKKPIDVTIDGYVRVKFLGLNHTIKFNKDQFNYSSNLLADLGLNNEWDKLKEKYKFLNKI